MSGSLSISKLADSLLCMSLIFADDEEGPQSSSNELQKSSLLSNAKSFAADNYKNRKKCIRIMIVTLLMDMFISAVIQLWA